MAFIGVIFYNKNILKFICHAQHDAENFLILFLFQKGGFLKSNFKRFQNELKSIS